MSSRKRTWIVLLVCYVAASATATWIADRVRPEEMLEESRTSLWRLHPGYQGPSAPGAFDTPATVGKDGMRVVPGRPAGPGRVRVLAIGDSFTFGWGVRDEDTYPAQLQGRLDRLAPGRYQVFNGGFPGCTSYQARQRLSEWLQELDPDVLLLMLGRNDGRRAALTDERSQRFLRWKPEWSRYVFPLQFLHYRSLQGLARRFGAAPTSRVGEEAFGENLRTIVSRSSDLGVEVVLIEHWAPPVYTVKDLSAELGVPLVRAQGRFNKVKRETGEELFLPKHHHPNAAGYAVLTREIARVFRRELSESSTGTAEVQADLP